MNTLRPSQHWWTAEALAESGLPDIPQTRQGVDALIKRQGWRAQPELARRRTGKGGGWEYSWKLLPAAAQKKLVTQQAESLAAKPVDRDQLWARYEALPQHVKDKAQARLKLIAEVDALAAIFGRDQAVNEIARQSGIGARTLWAWLALVEGMRLDDRLALLAPKSRAGARVGAKLDCDMEFFDILKGDFLRLAAPSFSTSYRRALRIAADRGLGTLPERTMRRRMDAAVSQVTQTLLRKGVDALKRLYPSQVRDKSALHALEAVNGDFHKFDVFVRWPAQTGSKRPGAIGRPQMVAFQDVYSGRILAWRLSDSANSQTVLLAAGDMIESWGIPEHVLLDNGREFAAKSVTGGAKTRYRFKVQEDDIPGLFTSLGCQIHWATPYSGQSKPIERAFRDMCDNIAKDPRFAGAWTGNRPEAKPEDYGSHAVPYDDFLRVLAEGIQEHNSRSGRRSEVAFGRSFAEVFDESYASAPIRKATEAQRRLWLMGAKGVRANTRNGEIKFMGNLYWGDWMTSIAGKHVVVRYDEADLWSGVHLYTLDNVYLGYAGAMEKSGFLDTEEARVFNRTRRAWQNAEQAAAEAHRRYTASDVGAMLNALSETPAATTEAKVVRPLFGKGPAKTGSAPNAVTEMQAALITEFKTAQASRVETPPEETPRNRFQRALRLERALADGQRITSDQRRWLGAYQTTSEYQGEKMLWDDQGDQIFG